MLLKEEVVGRAEACWTVKGNKRKAELSLSMAPESRRMGDTEVTVEADGHDERLEASRVALLTGVTCLLPPPQALLIYGSIAAPLPP